MILEAKINLTSDIQKYLYRLSRIYAKQMLNYIFIYRYHK